LPQPYSSPSPPPSGSSPIDPVLDIDGTQVDALRQEIAGLKAALVSRASIDQARGILVARFRISPDGAFDLLVRWSQDRNIKLRAIAEALVAIAQHGPDGSGVDRSLGRWLVQQLAEDATGP
jgi:ANTAR domain